MNLAKIVLLSMFMAGSAKASDIMPLELKLPDIGRIEVPDLQQPSFEMPYDVGFSASLYFDDSPLKLSISWEPYGQVRLRSMFVNRWNISLTLYRF